MTERTIYRDALHNPAIKFAGAATAITTLYNFVSIMISKAEQTALLVSLLTSVVLWEFILKPLKRKNIKLNWYIVWLGSGISTAAFIYLYYYYDMLHTRLMPVPILMLIGLCTTSIVHHVYILWSADFLKWILKKGLGIDINIDALVRGSANKMQIKHVKDDRK